jgi:hypothetical protein
MARDEEISIEIATGKPAVETTQRSAYISYAELKYPIPSIPRSDSIGILKASPIIFTIKVESERMKTPDMKPPPTLSVLLSFFKSTPPYRFL